MENLTKGTIIILEDNIEYLIADTIATNGNLYMFLVNIDDDKDIMIRKYDTELDLIIGLDDDNELTKISSMFLTKFGE